MKKAGLAFLFLCAGFGVFAQSGVILEASGVVEIKSPNDENFIAARTGDLLSQNTIVSTGFRSFATIEIGSASITLKPLTQLTLTAAETFDDAEALEVNLQTGRVRVEINSPEGTRASISVKSPLAAISAAGSFEFDTCNLYVDDGEVSFSGKRGQTMHVFTRANSRVKANTTAANPLERKTIGLFSSPLAGMNTIGGPLRMGVPFTIGLNFFSE